MVTICDVQEEVLSFLAEIPLPHEFDWFLCSPAFPTPDFWGYETIGRGEKARPGRNGENEKSYF